MPGHFAALEHEWKDGGSWLAAQDVAAGLIAEKLTAGRPGNGRRMPGTHVEGLTAIMEGTIRVKSRGESRETGGFPYVVAEALEALPSNGGGQLSELDR